MQYHFPDNPVQIPPHALLELEEEEPGRYIGQLKWDGWRKPMYLENGCWEFFAKHDVQKSPPPTELLKELKSFNFPDGTAFDAEWIGMRAVEHLNGQHYFKLFDLLCYKGLWQGDLPFERRYANLKELFEIYKAKADAPHVKLTTIREGNLLQMFEESKSIPITEGIVIKARDSKLKGNLNHCADNGLWKKIKWRQ
jgi:ATP-dependent DNA ligase